MRKTLFVAVAALLIACTPRPTQGIRHASPASVGMDPQRLALIDSTVQASIEAGDIPGAVIGVVHHGALVYKKAFGYKALLPEKDTMTVETMFDLASVSKCVGTTLSFMQLIETGKVRLVDPVKYYFPDFQPWEDPETHEKVDVTVQDLLTHSSGIAPYLPNVPAYIEQYGENSPDSLIMWISTQAKRNFRPGTQQLYSCLNFITLQNILQKVTGERLCDYAKKNVFDKLGLQHTTYFNLYGEEPCRPDLADLAELCAPTEQLEDGHILKAEVHDPTARLANAGNSGNAGVFSDVEDLALVSAALLNGGAYNGKRILSPLTVEQMFRVPETNAYEVARALGWDTYYTGPYTSGCIFNPRTVRGHTGYTGTSLIMDLETNTAVIVLAHRVHPKDEGATSRLRSTVASIVASSILY
ncbi:MAG: serine hydrolase [Bacteroidales bacterium]|nr:serine hydrolase [Bacteroidales bacterium]